MFLFASSCDLLDEEEEEEIDYIAVTVSVQVCTTTVSDDFIPSTKVHVKIYKEGISIIKKLTTGENGCVYYKTGTYHLRKDEEFTASTYLIDHPDVYTSAVLTYDEAKNNAVDNGDEAKFFAWMPNLLLIVP